MLNFRKYLHEVKQSVCFPFCFFLISGYQLRFFSALPLLLCFFDLFLRFSAFPCFCCFFTFLRFNAFLLLCFSVFLLILCLSAVPLFCCSSSYASLRLCFSAFCFSLLFCLPVVLLLCLVFLKL